MALGRPTHGEIGHECPKTAKELSLEAISNGCSNDDDIHTGQYTLYESGNPMTKEIRLSRHNTAMSIEILDDTDVFYLKISRITPEDFSTMKSEQGITVPFGSFFDLIKTMLINSKDVGNPMYLAIAYINDQTTVLYFKERTHLGLQDATRLCVTLISGNYSMLKGRVEKKITALETQLNFLSLEYDQHRSNMCRVESLIQNVICAKNKDQDQMMLDMKNQEILYDEQVKRLRANYNELIVSVKRQFHAELDTLANVHSSKVFKLKKALENTRVALERLKESKEQLTTINIRMAVRTNELTQRVESLETENKVLRSKIMLNDQQNTVDRDELLASIKQCTDLLKYKDQEIAELREKNSKMRMELDADKNQLEKKIHEAKYNREQAMKLQSERNYYKTFCVDAFGRITILQKQTKLLLERNNQAMQKLEIMKDKAHDFESKQEVLTGKVLSYMKVIKNLQSAMDKPEEEKPKKESEIKKEKETDLEEYYCQKFKAIKLERTAAASSDADANGAVRWNPLPNFHLNYAIPREGAVGGVDSGYVARNCDYPPLPEIHRNVDWWGNLHQKHGDVRSRPIRLVNSNDQSGSRPPISIPGSTKENKQCGWKGKN